MKFGITVPGTVEEELQLDEDNENIPGEGEKARGGRQLPRDRFGYFRHWPNVTRWGARGYALHRQHTAHAAHPPGPPMRKRLISQYCPWSFSPLLPPVSPNPR